MAKPNRPKMTQATNALAAAEARAHDAPAIDAAAGEPTDADLLEKPKRRPKRILKPSPRVKSSPDAALFVRMTEESLSVIRDLAKREGITVQDLGIYAMQLALDQDEVDAVIEAPPKRRGRI